MKNEKINDALEIGLNVAAPKFDLTDIFGRSINLEAYRGKKVLLGFFRHAGCPFCNLRVHDLQKNYQKLEEKNLYMIFFFQSKDKLLLSSSFHKEVSPIPLIADPDKVWYETYGIENSTIKSVASHLTSFIQTAVKAKLKSLPLHAMSDGEPFGTMPAEFLLDENLIIRKMHYSQTLLDRMPLETIYDFAKG
jgi:peroxiredoxin